MMRGALYVAVVLLWAWVCTWIYPGAPAAPAKTETLSCVRVKEVAPGGKINYLCEARK